MKIRLLLIVVLLCGVISGQQYFPDHAFDQNDRLNEIPVERYSARLEAFHEGSLWELSQTTNHSEIYRFLWMRSFHRTIVVRLTVQADGTGILITKIGTALAPDKQEEVATKQSRVLSKETVAAFIAQVDRDNYWSLPTRTPAEPNTFHLDGAEWVLEGHRNGSYKIVDRFSPREGPVRDLCLAMVRGLAEMNLQDREIY